MKQILDKYAKEISKCTERGFVPITREEKFYNTIKIGTKISNNYYNTYKDSNLYKDDFDSVTLTGISKAIDKYDERKGVKFITFATTCIENELRGLINNIKKQEALGIVSMQESYTNDSEGNEMLYEEKVKDQEEYNLDILEEEALKDFLEFTFSELSIRNQRIVIYMLM